MQNSRFGRAGKQTLKNRTNFTLLQQINPLQFSNDQPVKNASTVYYDENGKQTQYDQLKASRSKVKASNNQKQADSQPQAQMEGSKVRDMYALPVVNSNDLMEKSNKSRLNTKLVKSQYMSDRPILDSIKEVNHSDFFKKKNQKNNKLLSIKRPKGFLKKGQQFEEIDFIGGNLYEVEDIISDIGKIMEHTKRKNIVHASSQQKPNPFKANKWLNNHFGGQSKLDQMLMNYKSTPDQQKFPILEQFYRQSKSKDNQTKRQQKPVIKGKLNTFNFQSKIIKNDEHKLSIALIKWNQMPMIASKWTPSIFLKLQSFPQQEQYRKVVLKAYSMNIKSYSIFIYEDAGLMKPQKQRMNDKNTVTKKLMSQQQYAKVWQQKLPQNSLSQQEREILMEFDIQWYRTIIELCYHSGLEDLLQKQYDIEAYIDTMKSIQRDQIPTAENIIVNQMKYLVQYFEQIYASTTNQTTLGFLRINNDEKMSIESIQSKFNQMLNQNSEQSEKSVNFCIWSLNQDNSNLVVILQLCGNQDGNHVNMDKSQELIKINMSKPDYLLQIINQIEKADNSQKNQEQYQQKFEESEQKQKPSQNNEQKIENSSVDRKKLLIKNSPNNDWQIYMKIENNSNKPANQLKLTLVQQLLFGILYKVEPKK